MKSLTSCMDEEKLPEKSFSEKVILISNSSIYLKLIVAFSKFHFSFKLFNTCRKPFRKLFAQHEMKHKWYMDEYLKWQSYQASEHPAKISAKKKNSWLNSRKSQEKQAQLEDKQTSRNVSAVVFSRAPLFMLINHLLYRFLSSSLLTLYLCIKAFWTLTSSSQAARLGPALIIAAVLLRLQE